MAVRSEAEVVTRVRTLLKCTAAKGLNLSSTKVQDVPKKQLERWKALFKIYDDDGNGILNFQEVRKLVRQDLKLKDSVVSDWELRQLWKHIDLDNNDSVDIEEFLAFVQGGKGAAEKTIPQAVFEVGRCLKQALRKNKLSPEKVERLFGDYEEADSAKNCVRADGQMGAEEIRRFFREVLEVSKQECCDYYLVQVIHFLDRDNNKSISSGEFLDFVRYWSMADEVEKSGRRHANAAAMAQIAAKNARQKKKLEASSFAEKIKDSKQNQRLEKDERAVPQKDSGVSFIWMPGRTRQVANRHGQTMSGRLHPFDQEEANIDIRSMLPQRPSTAPELSSVSPGARKGTFISSLTGSQLEQLGEDTLSLSRKGHTVDFGASKRSSSAPTGERQGPRAGQKKPNWKYPHGYIVMKSDGLNRVETKLFEAGVDLRGSFHRHPSVAAVDEDLMPQTMGKVRFIHPIGAGNR